MKIRDQELKKSDQKLHRLKNIVSFEKLLDFEEIVDEAEKAGVRVLTMSEVMEAGDKMRKEGGSFTLEPAKY